MLVVKGKITDNLSGRRHKNHKIVKPEVLTFRIIPIIVEGDNDHLAGDIRYGLGIRRLEGATYRESCCSFVAGDKQIRVDLLQKWHMQNVRAPHPQLRGLRALIAALGNRLVQIGFLQTERPFSCQCLNSRRRPSATAGCGPLCLLHSCRSPLTFQIATFRCNPVLVLV